jgi:hypothetical protein
VVPGLGSRKYFNPQDARYFVFGFLVVIL